MPSCLDEFYKVIGELCVRELLNQRSDLDSPVQLMKELLLGQTPSNFDFQNTSVISQMLVQALNENRADVPMSPSAGNEFIQSLLQSKFNQESNYNNLKPEEAIYEDQNMVDCFQNENKKEPSNLEPEKPQKKEVVHQKKREIKSETKLKISRDACKKVAKAEKPPQKAKKGVKRAPKKKNPRVFLSKISTSADKNALKHKRICTEETIKEY